MKRKILALLMAIAAVITVTACGEKTSEYHFGEISENTYVNDVYGITADFNDEWIVYSEHEILEWNGYSAEDEVLESDIKAGDEFTEIIAYDYDGYDSVMVRTQKLESDATVDFNELAEADKAEYEEYYASVEYTNIEATVSTRECLGEENTCVNISAELDGDKVYITVVYAQVNDYLLTFEVCSTDDAGAEAILEDFQIK